MPWSRAMYVGTSPCSDTVTTRTTIAPSTSTVTMISPVTAGEVRVKLDKRIITAPMRIAAKPPGQSVVESFGDLVAWQWRSDVQHARRHGLLRFARNDVCYDARAVTIQTDAGSSTASPLANGVSASRMEAAAALRSSYG